LPDEPETKKPTPEEPVSKQTKIKAPKERVRTTKNANPRRPQGDSSYIERYLQEWGTIIIEDDACEYCKDDYMSIPDEALDSFQKYHNEEEKMQTATDCQLKTVLKVMIESIRKNRSNKNRAKSYNSGFGHKSFSYKEGVFPTCRCKWRADNHVEFTMVDLNAYLKDNLGFSGILD